jgi:hypothetical protein
VRAGGEAGAETGEMGFVDTVLAVGGMLVDDDEFDEVEEADAGEFGAGAFVAIGSVGEGDAVDFVEGAPDAGQSVPILLFERRRIQG